MHAIIAIDDFSLLECAGKLDGAVDYPFTGLQRGEVPYFHSRA